MSAHKRYSERYPRRLWPGLLALVLVVMQPLLSGLHNASDSAHTHYAGQSPFHTHEDTIKSDTHHDSHHHNHADEAHPSHAAPPDASPSLSVNSDHQHELCCSHGDTPMRLTSFSARSGLNESQSVPAPHIATPASVFRLEVLAGIHSRAGPPSDVTVRSQFLRSSLLGRAPPLSV